MSRLKIKKSSLFPDNRFDALTQFLTLIDFTKDEWNSLFNIFYKSSCGYLDFKIGDMIIGISIGSGETIAKGEEDWIQLKFEVVKDNVEKTAVYTFSVSELNELSKQQQLQQH